MGDIIPYINPKFYRHAESVLLSLAKGEIALKAELMCTQVLLSGDYGDDYKDFKPSNINAIPTAQVEWIAAHDNLSLILNDRLSKLAYLLKNVHLMSKLIKHFGPQYDYSVSQQSGHIESTSVDLVYFSDPTNIEREMRDSVIFIFQYLHGIRAHFTPETYEFIENDKNRDPVATQFFQGKLPEPIDMTSYVEIMFFTNYEMPLGYFQPYDHIDKWIERQHMRHGMENSLNRLLAFEGITEEFPGITCPELKNSSILTTKARSDFSNALWGIIPKQGITLGEHHTKPQRYKPHLVGQSPR